MVWRSEVGLRYGVRLFAPTYLAPPHVWLYLCRPTWLSHLPVRKRATVTPTQSELSPTRRVGASLFSSKNNMTKQAFRNHGAGDRSRTYDLRITNALLYQLSYTGIGGGVILARPHGTDKHQTAATHSHSLLPLAAHKNIFLPRPSELTKPCLRF